MRVRFVGMRLERECSNGTPVIKRAVVISQQGVLWISVRLRATVIGSTYSHYGSIFHQGSTNSTIVQMKCECSHVHSFERNKTLAVVHEAFYSEQKYSTSVKTKGKIKGRIRN